jgi:uncharacterized protein YbjT (DUF2867 family)
MRVFLTGANGFIGGAAAVALIAAGHRVRGLVRSAEKAELVTAYGIEAVVGSLDDAALLQTEARAADAVINTASSDHRGAVEALIAATPIPASLSFIRAEPALSPISPWAIHPNAFFMKRRRLRRCPKEPRAQRLTGWCLQRPVFVRWCFAMQ